MLNSKHRAYLRGLANTLDCNFHVGKGELSVSVENSLAELLQNRELVKACVLKTVSVPVAEIAQQLADSVGAEVVQVIGRRFVVYRHSERLAEAGKAIVLPR